MIQIKYIIQVSMLSLWFFACIGQPIITIINDGQSLVSNTINEEEQKEQQVKKNSEEEKIISKSLTDYIFGSDIIERPNTDNYTLAYSDCFRQIVLPPPEYSI
ncbi:hypothetical protein [Sediminicola arcticus]|jgi:hypothetical protein|uniref:Lipoprotein n=1 Tax=Sediminicola arcticus TaxID=1574308 RepID=A0ABV2SRK9_9FLAO